MKNRRTSAKSRAPEMISLLVLSREKNIDFAEDVYACEWYYDQTSQLLSGPNIIDSSQGKILLRDTRADDVPHLLGIYNDAILNTDATFEQTPQTLEQLMK